MKVGTGERHEAAFDRFWRDCEWPAKKEKPWAPPKPDTRLRKVLRMASQVCAGLLILFLIGPLAPFGWVAIDAIMPTTVKYLMLAGLGLVATLVLYGMAAALVMSLLLHRIWPSWAGKIDWGEGTGDWWD